MFANMTTPRSADFVGEGRVRLGLALFAAALLAISFFLPSIPGVKEFLPELAKKQSAIYSSAFTFHSIFWAAMLTIWSMLKSRATRYVERLTESATFREFMRGFEIRVVLGLLAIALSFVVYISDPTLTLQPSAGNTLIFVWLFLFVGSIVLLFDSLLTAKVVLD